MKSNEEIMNHDLVWKRNDYDFLTAKGAQIRTANIKLPDCGTCSVVWDENENDMEHVSVSPKKKFDRLGRENLPTWNDMCILKDVFFYAEEEVYQIHPKKSEYVNLKSNCLHLWRPIVHELGGIREA